MGESLIVDDESIPLVIHHDEGIDYDDYNTPNTSTADETM